MVSLFPYLSMGAAIGLPDRARLLSSLRGNHAAINLSGDRRDDMQPRGLVARRALLQCGKTVSQLRKMRR
jgi:hypothetical protein